MTFRSVPQKTSGGQDEIWSADEQTRELLSLMLLELKKITFQLSLITDEEDRE